MSLNVSDSGIKTVTQHADRINKAVNFIAVSSPTDASKLLGGLYVALGLSDDAFTKMCNPNADPYEIVEMLVEAENAFEAAGVRVR